MINLESTIKSIKKSGFGYVKVELEASLNRRGNGSGTETCDECEGDGNSPCDNCEGEGTLTSTITTTSGREVGTEETECTDCYGEGRTECDPCGGSGEIESDNLDFGNEHVCDKFIKENVSKEAQEALIFGMFYNDGSVDSEFTFTLPIEKAQYLTEYVEAFNLLAEENGHGMEVDGAGMHIAVMMTESGGRYPVPSAVRLDPTKLNNFKTEVTKLLPALFIAACSGNFTREFGYRPPQVAEDKYSAVNLFRGGMEYRVFETCYQRPEAIFEFLGTIARTLEYYADPSKKVKSLGKEFEFYEDEGVGAIASTPQQIRIIKSQLGAVTPKGMTIKQFMKNREINLSVGEASKRYAKRIARAKKLYKEHLRSYESGMKRELTESQKVRAIEMQTYGYFGREATPEDIKARVLGLRKPENQDKFINSNLGVYAEYSVTV